MHWSNVFTQHVDMASSFADIYPETNVYPKTLTEQSNWWYNLLVLTFSTCIVFAKTLKEISLLLVC